MGVIEGVRVEGGRWGQRRRRWEMGSWGGGEKGGTCGSSRGAGVGRVAQGMR